MTYLSHPRVDPCAGAAGSLTTTLAAGGNLRDERQPMYTSVVQPMLQQAAASTCEQSLTDTCETMIGSLNRVLDEAQCTLDGGFAILDAHISRITGNGLTGNEQKPGPPSGASLPEALQRASHLLKCIYEMNNRINLLASI